jgi:hypothetical protein
MEPGVSGGTEVDPALRAQLDALYEQGEEIWRRFDIDVRQHDWHPFVPADYPRVERALLPFRGAGLRFLEWGSATGVITIMADLLGFEAYGIEIDPELVAIAADLAAQNRSGARFAAGSFLPAGYTWKSPTGDRRLGTIGRGLSGYVALQHPLEDFDLVFGYPWSGEEPMMHDLMRSYGRRGAYLLMYTAQGVQFFRGGQLVS